MENIFISEFSTLYYSEASKLMTIVWKDKMMGNETFRTHLEVFSKKAMVHRPKALFVDARKHKYTVPGEIQRWHDETIVPIYLKSGIKKMAFLNPESLFAELTTKKVFSLSMAKQSLPTAFFKSEEDALHWLEVECVS